MWKGKPCKGPCRQAAARALKGGGSQHVVVDVRTVRSRTHIAYGILSLRRQREACICVTHHHVCVGAGAGGSLRVVEA